MEAPPTAFICPITCDVMVEPVVAADGNSYEAAEIVQWLSKTQTSPLTNEPLLHTDLLPNIALRHAIEEWCGRQQTRTTARSDEQTLERKLKEKELECSQALDELRAIKALQQVNLNTEGTQKIGHSK